MANLIKLSNDLEYVPKEQLIQMSQNPDSTYPSYLVLAEIQRRTQNEKAYAAQQPQPETTVAEEVVQEYASSPQGLGAMTQPSGGNLSTPGAESNMAPPSPMQMMASGGRTGYQVGGQLTTEELRQQFLQGELGAQGSEVDLSQTYTPQIQNNEPKVQTKFGAAGQKIFELGSDVANWATENPADAAITGLMFVPGIGWAGSLGLKAISAISKASKGKNLLKSAFMKPGSSGYTSITAEGTKKVVPKIADKYSPLRTQATGLSIFGGKEVYDYGMSPAEEQLKPLTEDERIEKAVAEEMAKFTKNQSSNNINTNDVETTTKDKKGLGNFLPNADPSMLIGLGGAIMGANTIGELGSGISNVALGERARKDAQKLTGLQSRMMEAQIAKYEADVAGMDVKDIISEMNAINKGVESGAIQIDDEIRAYLTSLRKRLEEMRSQTGTGFVASESPTGGDFLDNREIA